MPGNLTCNQYREKIGDYSDAYFSDRKKDLDFCSEKCQSEWNELKKWEEVLGENSEPETGWAFCAWLRDEKHLKPQQVQQQDSAESLKKEYNKLWTDVHKDFSGRYQQIWEKYGLTYQDAQEWIPAGFEPNDWDDVKKWKNRSFTPLEVKSWLDIGLAKDDYYKFATYLKDKGIQPSKGLNLEKLGIEFTQDYLNEKYPKDQRKEIKELELPNKNLRGELDLSDFTSLEELNLYNNKLASLNVSDCSGLVKLSCSDNLLTNLTLPNNPTNLKKINLQRNNFNRDLSLFERAINLESLWLQSNKFYGSLKPLKKLSKLKEFSIGGTDVDSGLEYLPEGVERFDCSEYWREGAKCKVIESIYNHFGQDLKKLREFFNSLAQQWLDERFPENEVARVRNIVNKNYGKKRNKITELDINKEIKDQIWENEHRGEKEENKEIILKGGLWLKGFAKLQKLNCSDHQLTNLDLSGCPNLVELKCNNNKFHDLDFLKTLPNPEKLEKLYIQNNPELASKNLDILSKLTGLKELDISDCSSKILKGSLKSLENAKQLEKISINHTNISEGLEYLPGSCKELTCELDYDYGSVAIAKQLSKFSKEGKCDLEKWRTDQANNTIASIVPLERLFVIRSNVKQFFNKWGIKDKNLDEEESNWHISLASHFKKESEVSKLQSPRQYSKYRYFGGVKWIARATAVTGGILALTNQPIIGGSLATASPFVDAIASYFEENYYKKGEEKWNEFKDDADTFLDNYHELLGIIKKVNSYSELGKINQSLKNLKIKTNEFLEIYDKNERGEEGYEEIDLRELIEKREELAKDLKDKKTSKVWEIIEAVKELEDIVVKYRKDGLLIELDNNLTELEHEEKEKTIQLFQELADDIENVPKEIKHAIADFWEEISKLNKDKSLAIDISNPSTAGEVIDKKMTKRFIGDLEEIQAGWDSDGIKKAIDNLQKEIGNYKQQQDQTENQSEHSVVNVVENSEINQSLNSSSANLLNKDIELQSLSSEQQTHTVQLPYGTSGSSK